MTSSTYPGEATEKGAGPEFPEATTTATPAETACLTACTEGSTMI